jgi:hypothetical protein
MIGQSEIGNGSQIIFITLFSGKCSALLCLLQKASAKPCKKVLSQTGNVLTSNFSLQAHILLSTDGAAQALCHDVRWKSGGLQLQNLHYQQRMHNRIRCSQLRRMPYGTVGSHRRCECILEWLGTTSEDDVVSPSHHRAIGEKWILKTCLTQLFLFNAIFFVSYN